MKYLMAGFAGVFLALCYGLAGSTGLSGGIVGLVFASFNMGLLYLATHFTGRAMQDEKASGLIGCLVVFAIAAKVPVYGVGYLVIKPLGNIALNAFLCAIGLVYSLTIGWVALRR